MRNIFRLYAFIQIFVLWKHTEMFCAYEVQDMKLKR